MIRQIQVRVLAGPLKITAHRVCFEAPMQLYAQGVPTVFRSLPKGLQPSGP
jgi:hypothetical protein